MTAKTKTPRAKRARTASEKPKGGPRVIRKYPNRRLYDTVESRYVTLADIRRLVVERVDFVVLDRKSQQDITRSILLQVIAEQEGAGESLMSRDFLSQVIRSYGSGLQEFVGRYLDERATRPARQVQERGRHRSARDGDQRRAEELPALEGSAGRSVQPPARAVGEGEGIADSG